MPKNKDLITEIFCWRKISAARRREGVLHNTLYPWAEAQNSSIMCLCMHVCICLYIYIHVIHHLRWWTHRSITWTSQPGNRPSQSTHVSHPRVLDWEDRLREPTPCGTEPVRARQSTCASVRADLLCVPQADRPRTSRPIPCELTNPARSTILWFA
jgi:hypothetical protein